MQNQGMKTIMLRSMGGSGKATLAAALRAENSQPHPTVYGYARVSTEAQDLSSRLAQLKAAGCEKVFREKLTDTNTDRPQLRKLMAALAHGDVVITPAVDRLSRDTTDLLVIAREMRGRADAKAKGVKFGRRPKLTTHQQREAQKRIAVGETQRSIVRNYNVSRATISGLTA